MKLEVPRNVGQCWHVSLDGVEIKKVLAADDEAGEVVVHERDEKGHIVVERDELGKLQARRKILRGIVKLWKE